MIPKKIHFIWVGGKEKPKDIVKCMKTWKKHLKDYEIIEWNESNFDIHSHPFIEAAYKAKKWAYVSDYIRAYVIYHEGGIYVDTDVLVLDNFDQFLKHRAFVGFERPEFPFTAVFGAEKGHPFVKAMLNYYDSLKNYKFEFEDNNTISVSNILIDKYGCKTNNQYQELEDGIVVYPDTILCNPSANSVSIHVFNGSWLDEKKPLKRKLNKVLKLRLTTQKRAGWYRRNIQKIKK